MKNTIISSNKNGGDDEKSIVGDKILYFQQLIQKSLLSIQKYMLPTGKICATRIRY